MSWVAAGAGPTICSLALDVMKSEKRKQLEKDLGESAQRLADQIDSDLAAKYLNWGRK